MTKKLLIPLFIFALCWCALPVSADETLEDNQLDLKVDRLEKKVGKSAANEGTTKNDETLFNNNETRKRKAQLQAERKADKQLQQRLFTDSKRKIETAKTDALFDKDFKPTEQINDTEATAVNTTQSTPLSLVGLVFGLIVAGGGVAFIQSRKEEM